MIGTGAFSTCYQARDVKTGIIMACKQVSGLLLLSLCAISQSQEGKSAHSPPILNMNPKATRMCFFWGRKVLKRKVIAAQIAPIGYGGDLTKLMKFRFQSIAHSSF